MSRDSAPGALDFRPLLRALPALGVLDTLLHARFAANAHGDMARWQAALDALPDLVADATEFAATVRVDGTCPAAGRTLLQQQLEALRPWRKGPFRLFDVTIDTEWRSDWKWTRVLPHLAPLTGRRILDVGCGNGYFGWRMLEAGAALVVGVDPTLLFCMQHRALNRYLKNESNWVLPLRFEELPDDGSLAGAFDTVFSMGVIYHRRDPREHVARLYRHTARGGQVVLESLVVRDPPALRPVDRYARMRNVRNVPDPALLVRWLETAGFVDAHIVDITVTTVAEQRTTHWMPFESLAEALDPADPARTVEGHPAPVRAVAVARKPV